MRNYALGILVIVLGLYAYFGVFRKESKEKEAKAIAERLIPWSEDQTASLEWKGPDGEVKLVRDERGWSFEKPFQDRADLTAVDSWLTGIVGSQRKKEVFAAGETFDPTIYGLTEPQYQITVTSKGGEKRELEVGTERIFDQDLYVFDKTNQSLSTFGSSLETSLKKPAFELRDRRVWRVKDPLAQSIELVGKWKLEKNDLQKWTFEKESAGDLPVGTSEVDQYLVDFSNLRLLEVVSESSTPADLRRYGLNNPFAEVKVVVKEGEEPAVFKFAAKNEDQDPNNIYVTSDSLNFVGRLYSTVRDNVVVERRKFYDKTLPFQVQASQVDAVQFEVDQKDGQVDSTKLPVVVSEIHKLRLKEYLPVVPRLGATDSVSLRGSGEDLVFKMSWERLKGEGKDAADVRVLLEPGKIAGKMRASDIEELVKAVLPPAVEEEGEQGESSSVQ